MADTRFFLAIADRGIEIRVNEQLAPLGEVVSLRPVRRFRSELLRPRDTDAMIVSPEILEGVLRGERPTLEPFLDRACVVLALERETAPAHAKLMERADGWVMVDDQLDRLPEIVRLSMSGHCTVPRSIDTSGQLDSLIRSGVEQLTPEECVVLAELGYGRSDNAIINCLSMGKSKVRALVQSIVTKLRVSNRIEAGAVAVKHKRQISRMRQRSISALAVTLILLSWMFVSVSGLMVAIVR